MRPDESLSISYGMKLIGRPIAYYPEIAKAIGSVKTAIFLCQFMYWQGKGQSNEIYKSSKEILEETGLSYEEQRSARRLLKELNILNEVIKGIPPTIHFEFNWNVLDELLMNKLQRPETDIEIKTNIKPIKLEVDEDFEKFWNTYDKKVNKPKCISLWNKLKKDDKERIFEHLKVYTLREKMYRKDPERYLKHRVWEDEFVGGIPKKTLYTYDGILSLIPAGASITQTKKFWEQFKRRDDGLYERA